MDGDIRDTDFFKVVMFCLENDALVEGFDRLYGCSLSKIRKRKPLDKMIDDACGYIGAPTDDFHKFFGFVFEFVWSRLPPDAFVQEEAHGR